MRAGSLTVLRALLMVSYHAPSDVSGPLQKNVFFVSLVLRRKYDEQEMNT